MKYSSIAMIGIFCGEDNSLQHDIDGLTFYKYRGT